MLSKETILNNIEDILYIVKMDNKVIYPTNIQTLNLYKKIIASQPFEDNEYYVEDNDKWFSYNSKLIKENGQIYTLEIFKDITKYKKRELDLERDDLTNLFNRKLSYRLIDRYIKESIKKNEEFTIILGDIDFFKRINDTYGHYYGDRVLNEIGKIFLSNTSHYNKQDIIGRIGGEEFVVVLKDMDRSEVVMLAKNIQRCIADMGIEQSYKKVSNNLTISIGIAFRDQEASDSFEKLYKKADTALYLAKTNGRNCIAFGHNIIAKGRRKKADEYDINYNEYSAKVVGER